MKKAKSPAEMKALGSKGGAATKAKHDADYYKRIGRLGGRATAREHGNDARVMRERLAAAKKGSEKMRALIAAGKTVLEITGQ